MILVRATVRLPGLRLGREVLVDPLDPTMVLYLKANYLVPVNVQEALALAAEVSSSPESPQDVREEPPALQDAAERIDDAAA